MGRSDSEAPVASPSATADACDDPVDVAFLLEEPGPGRATPIVRLRARQLELGRVAPLEEGKPIHGEVVKLTPREGNRRLCDVETLLPAPELAAGAGPAQVATREFREGWERVFGRARSGDG